MVNDSFPGTLMAKPFLKWAGGKRQLITEIESALPKNIHKKKELTYKNFYRERCNKRK